MMNTEMPEKIEVNEDNLQAIRNIQGYFPPRIKATLKPAEVGQEIDLAEYEETVPGIGERIWAMYQKEIAFLAENPSPDNGFAP